MELLDYVDQVVGAPIVQEEKALAGSPQRRRAEFVRPPGSLRYSIGKSRAHVVEGKVGKRSKRGVVQVRELRRTCSESGRVAYVAAHIVELGLAIEGGGAQGQALRISSRCLAGEVALCRRRIGEHEERLQFDVRGYHHRIGRLGLVEGSGEVLGSLIAIAPCG